MTIAAKRSSCPRGVRRPKILALCLITAALGIVPAGCGSPRAVVFSHQFHREKFRLSGQEIMGMQFLTSTNVLAQADPATTKATPTGEHVLLVKQGTPMKVTQVGPNWIRVSVLEDGTGVHFLAEDPATSGGTSDYYLATTVEGSDELTMVMNVPGHTVIHEGVRYEVVEGFAAMLTCEWGEIQALIDKRGVGESRED